MLIPRQTGALMSAQERGDPRFGDGSPGLWGYVIAIALSVLIFSLLLVVEDHRTGDTWPEAWAVLPLVLIVGTVLAVPVGAIGAAIIHMVTGNVHDQWAHVGLAVLMGLLAGLITFHWTGLTFALGIACGLGRAAVIPLARRRSAGRR
jgi:heme/copper-type cytochrome/quinol oxidase subunit 3